MRRKPRFQKTTEVELPPKVIDVSNLKKVIRQHKFGTSGFLIWTESEVGTREDRREKGNFRGLPFWDHLEQCEFELEHNVLECDISETAAVEARLRPLVYGFWSPSGSLRSYCLVIEGEGELKSAAKRRSPTHHLVIKPTRGVLAVHPGYAAHTTAGNSVHSAATHLMGKLKGLTG